MSELACSFLMMSFECLCWRPHLLGFPPWAELLANEGTRPLPWAELPANESTPPPPLAELPPNETTRPPT